MTTTTTTHNASPTHTFDVDLDTYVAPNGWVIGDLVCLTEDAADREGCQAPQDCETIYGFTKGVGRIERVESATFRVNWGPPYMGKRESWITRRPASDLTCATVYVPDGYYANGTPRPQRKATVIKMPALGSDNTIVQLRMDDDGSVNYCPLNGLNFQRGDLMNCVNCGFVVSGGGNCHRKGTCPPKPATKKNKRKVGMSMGDLASPTDQVDSRGSGRVRALRRA